MFSVHFELPNKFFSPKNRKLFFKTENKRKKQLPNIPLTFCTQKLLFLFFFLISKKNILKEPQEYKRPTKEYRGGHKQRENTRENKKQKE